MFFDDDETASEHWADTHKLALALSGSIGISLLCSGLLRALPRRGPLWGHRPFLLNVVVLVFFGSLKLSHALPCSLGFLESRLGYLGLPWALPVLFWARQEV